MDITEVSRVVPLQFWSSAHLSESMEIVAELSESGAKVSWCDLTDVQRLLWESIAENMEELGYSEIGELVGHYLRQFDPLSNHGDVPNGDELLDLILYWHQEFADLLDTPNSNVSVLREILLDPAWPKPLPDGASSDAALDLLTLEDDQCDLFEIEPLSQQQGAVTIDPDLLEMVAGEVHRLVEYLNLDHEQQSQAWYEQEGTLQNIGRACETIGLSGLAFVFRLLRANLLCIVDGEQRSDEELSLLTAALQLIGNYLDRSGDDCRAELISALQQSEWPLPLDENEVSPLFNSLAFELVAMEPANEESARLQVLEEDLSLQLPEGINHELYSVVLRELPHLTASLSAAIQDLSGDRASLAALQDAQRIAHTLKGVCNTIGIQGIASLTHHLEDIFDLLTEASVVPGVELAEMLLDAADCLEAMSECVLAEGAPPEGALELLQSVLDWHHLLKCEGVEAHCVSVSDVVEESRQNIEEQPQLKSSSPVLSSTTIDEMLLAVGESSALGDRAYDRVSSCLLESREIRDMSWQINELASEMDRLINIQSPASRQNQALSDFDTLEMEQYGELHSNISRLVELTADVRELNARMGRQLMETSDLLQEQHLRHREQTESIQNMRLVSVQSIVSRCQRIVRQAAKMTGKECTLSISGEQVLVDGDMLNELVEPLMHMLRNAVDHGVEASELRLNAGKPKEGRIHLSFVKERNFLHVVCQDDGAGLNEEAILRKAVGKGLINPDEALTSEQIQRLIFRPGFSTKEQSSQVSGRGIGMDIIKNQIALMNGSMELYSKPGEGLRISITLLANLHDARVLLVKHQNHSLALSEHGIEQIFAAVDGRVVREGDGSYFYQLPDRSYPLESLTHLLNLGESEFVEGPCGAILFKDGNGAETALPVDQIMGSSTLMIRSFGEYLKGVYGVLGGVLLGNGDVLPVVDLFELIGDRERRELISAEERLIHRRTEVRKTAALVVDDSLSARKLTAQLLSDSGFDVQTAIDGLDAIEMIESRKPEIILVDMEMPRMNGIELSRYLRDDPALAHIPVIMITSRSTDKHRQQAEQAGVDRYFVKPFNEDDLMLEIEMLLRQRLEMAA